MHTNIDQLCTTSVRAVKPARRSDVMRPWPNSCGHYTIAARCDGPAPWRFVHPRGKMAPEEKPRVPFSLEVLLYLSNLLFLFLKFCCHPRTLLHSLKQFVIVPSNRRFFVLSAGNLPTVGTIEVMYTPVNITQPGYLRICCTARDWFWTNQTSQFVTEV